MIATHRFAPPLGPACRELLALLEANAVTQPDGRRIVWTGSSEIATSIGKSPGTITQQLGQLRSLGLVTASRRGSIELPTTASGTPATAATPLQGADPAPDSGNDLVNAIVTLTQLANEYPASREGIASAIAIVANRTANGVRVSLRGSTSEREKESFFLSLRTDQASQPFADDSRTVRDTSTSVFQIKRIVEPLVQLERETKQNNNINLTTGTASELAYLSVDELERAVEAIRAMFLGGTIKSAIGFLVSEARAGTLQRFATIPVTVPEVPTGDSPEADPLDDCEEQVEEVDPDTAAFEQLPEATRDHYRAAALDASSGSFHDLLANQPAALTGAAAELWRTTTASAANSVERYRKRP